MPFTLDEMPDRLRKQLAFIIEIDKLKSILRRNDLIHESRKENDAEHSWHLAVMAVLLHEYASAPNLDLLRVLKMILIHDVVEIDAGDSFLYAVDGAPEKERKERAAADRIFALLPPDQRNEMRALWDEFEAGVTPEAEFAKAMDRLQPLLLNYCTEGRDWKEHHITLDKPLGLGPNVIARSSEVLADYARKLLHSAAELGYFHNPGDPVKE